MRFLLAASFWFFLPIFVCLFVLPVGAAPSLISERQATGLVGLGSILLGVRMVLRSFVKWHGSSRKGLEFYANFLNSKNHLVRRFGISYLSLLVGDRFGFPGWSLSAQQKYHLLWKQWWDESNRNLVWDSTLGVYVERGLISTK